MLLFGKKPSIKRLPDKFWMSLESRNLGLINKINQNTDNNLVTFIVCFFKNTVNEVSDLLTNAEIKFKNISEHSSNFLTLDINNRNVFLINNENLKRINSAQELHQKFIWDSTNFIFPEHYPTYSKEEETINLLSTITNKKGSVLFLGHLEELIFQAFGANRIKEVMNRLGLKETDCVEHSLISSAIKNAQKKLESKVSLERQSNSAKDWFNLNFPNI